MQLRLGLLSSFSTHECVVKTSILGEMLFGWRWPGSLVNEWHCCCVFMVFDAITGAITKPDCAIILAWMEVHHFLRI